MQVILQCHACMQVLSIPLRVQIIWSKINWLIGSIDLTPWYLTVLQGNRANKPCAPLHADTT